MTTRPYDGKRYGDSRMTTMMQAMIDAAVSEKFELVNFEMCVHQKIDDTVSSARYHVEMT